MIRRVSFIPEVTQNGNKFSFKAGNDKNGANNISFVISDWVCNNKIQTDENASFRNEIGAIKTVE